MRAFARIGAAGMISVLLASCAPGMLMRSDRYRICSVAVVEKVESPAFRANPLANPTGPVSGAAGGALAGLTVPGAWPFVFITVPVFAALGAIGGAACSAGASAHPDANANFQAILADADARAQARAISAAAVASLPRDTCAARTAEAGAVPTPDAVIELDTLDIGMACPTGKQSFGASVQWRVLDGADGHELAAGTTRCVFSSSSEFGEWFADTGRARAEVELLLTGTGKRIAEQVFAPMVSRDCRLP
jgi:hypothetical protein